MRTPRLPVVDWTDAPADLNGLSISPKDEIWFLRVCHHISSGLYKVCTTQKLNALQCRQRTRTETSSRHIQPPTIHFTEKYKAKGATIHQQRHHSNGPLQFFNWNSILFVYFTFEFFSTVRFLFPSVLFLSFRCVISFCCRPTWYPVGITI